MTPPGPAIGYRHRRSGSRAAPEGGDEQVGFFGGRGAAQPEDAALIPMRSNAPPRRLALLATVVLAVGLALTTTSPVRASISTVPGLFTVETRCGASRGLGFTNLTNHDLFISVRNPSTGARISGIILPPAPQSPPSGPAENTGHIPLSADQVPDGSVVRVIGQKADGTSVGGTDVLLDCTNGASNTTSTSSTSSPSTIPSAGGIAGVTIEQFCPPQSNSPLLRITNNRPPVPTNDPLTPGGLRYPMLYLTLRDGATEVGHIGVQAGGSIASVGQIFVPPQYHGRPLTLTAEEELGNPVGSQTIVFVCPTSTTSSTSSTTSSTTSTTSTTVSPPSLTTLLCPILRSLRQLPFLSPIITLLERQFGCRS